MSKSLEEMSGEKKGSPKLKLNEIRLNGESGVFIYKDVLAGMKEVDGKKSYEEREIGTQVSLVMLKIRRRLAAYRDEQKGLQTNEHNTKNDYLTLYGEPKIQNGNNDELRTKYPELRTQQIIYALYEGELVRVIVKGSALGSKNKAKGTLTFYDYVQIFKQMPGGKEHFYNYETILLPVAEKGKGSKKYFALTFKVGTKLTEEEMADVETNMTTAYNYCVQSDEYFNTKKVSPATTNAAEPDDTDTGEVDADEEGSDDEDDGGGGADVAPEDIPF